MKKIFKSALIGLSAFTLSLSSGCGLNSGKSTYIAFISGNKSTEFISAVEKGASDAADEAGYKVICYYSQTSLLEQISSINDAIEKGVKCIMIDPIDVNALDGTFKKAAENHIKIITIGSENAKKYSESYRGGVTACVGSNCISTGAIAARKAAALLQSTDKVIAVNSTVNNVPSNERVSGFIDQLPQTSASGCEIINSEYIGEDTSGIIKSLENQISKNNAVKLIFASNLTDTLCSCKAIEELSLTGMVHIIGCGYSAELENYIRNGTLAAVCVENPYNMGYLGVRYTKKLLDGTKVAVENDTGISYVTLDNIDSEDIQLLLSQIM